jgi:hypothetical protein
MQTNQATKDYYFRVLRPVPVHLHCFKVLGKIMRRLFILCVLLFSEASFAKHVYPKHLKQVDTGVSHQLIENYVFKEKAATFTLFAGNYVQKYEDAKAVYLIGESDCLEMHVVPPKNPNAAWTDRWDCGIFLPKDARKGAAIFMIRRTPEKKHSGNGVLIDAIIRAGYGSFDFPTSKHNDSKLRSMLVLVKS